MDTGNLDDLYREVILDHYREPKGREPIDSASATAEGFNPVCGDVCDIAIRVEDGRVTAVHVGGSGCSISVASGSILADLLVGRSVAEAARLVHTLRRMMHGDEPPADVDIGDLEVLAGIKDYPVRVKCALLPWTTLESCLGDGAGDGSDRQDAVTTEGISDDLQAGGGRDGRQDP